MEETNNTIEKTLKDSIVAMFGKMSRKGRMIFIGIVAIVIIKRPETLTWASAALYALPVIAITFLASLGTICQYKLDKVSSFSKQPRVIFKAKPEPDYNPDIPDSEHKT